MKIKELADNDFLYRDIESRIDSIKRKKLTYTTLYRTTKVLTIIAGASITVLTGWKISGGSIPGSDNVVLIISAVVTVFAAVEGVFNFRDKGRSYDALLFDLRRLRDRICYDFTKGTELYTANKDTHFDEYQRILQSQKSIIEEYDGGED
ncbi:DUF4231 domain-containing protein [Chitinophaga agri]|uniref:DUF4231 domain-containing protein n=1 Tax=Chitinophaga agri TaxID=2703787 RepID=A0A6B9Z9V8_9BACT|nr:DUF4231 domain-containing protein [Chitinophaga agri]QHS59092.1 DUF4231 domain-containing protein [Chitinophaga agri]